MAEPQALSYETEKGEYEALLVTPTSSGSFDGVSLLIAHDFLGPGENQIKVAQKYASEGAMSVIADLYGKDKRPSSIEEANEMAVAIRSDVPEMRSSMLAALALIEEHGGSAEKTVVLGTSVGGLAAIELGRTGTEVGHIVALWSVIENQAIDTAKPFASPFTLLQGSLDGLGPDNAVLALEAEVSAKSDVEVNTVVYEGVAHAFTLPFVGTDVSTGFAYNADATQDANAWIEKTLESVSN